MKMKKQKRGWKQTLNNFHTDLLFSFFYFGLWLDWVDDVDVSSMQLKKERFK